MKNLIKIAIILFALQINAQQIIKHVAGPSNTQGHITTINSAYTNGKMNAILIVTQNYGAYNDNEIGVWYASGKWKIFNQNRKPIPQNSKFNIMVVQPNNGKAFVHATGVANTSSHITTLESGLTNGKPNALVFVTQNYGKYNTSNVGVWYSGGKWKIYNENTNQKMPVGTKFNVLVLNPGDNKIGNSNIHGFSYTNNSSGHLSVMNAPVALPKEATVFATQNWKNVYNPNHMGVWYNGKKWTAYNQNRKTLPKGVRFNVFTSGQGAGAATQSSTSVPNDNILLPNLSVLTYGEIVKTGPIASPEASGNDRKGPNATLAEVFPQVPQIAILKNTFNLHEEIYRDQNPDANVYYYLPKEFTLKWDKVSNDYAFNVYYMSSEENKRGSVLLNVEVTSNIKSEEIALAEQILSSQLNKNIRLLPLDLRDVPKVNFEGLLARYNINPESVSARISSDYHQPIVLDWRMDSNIDNFVGAMLNQPVGAMLNFMPYGDSTSVKPIPVQFNVNTSNTFGKIKFENAQLVLDGWTNYLDYPVLIQELTVLKKKGRNFNFETLQLPSDRIEPGAILNLTDPTVINSLSDAASIKGIWLSYEVDENCDTCNQKVKRKIIGGTSGSEITKLEIQMLNALEYSEATAMKVLIKSVQADPNGVNEIELPPFQIAEDGQTIGDIQLFVPEGKDLSYKYQAVLVMNDGDVLKSDWKNGNSNLLVFGEKQIKRLFPNKTKDEIIENAKNGAITKLKDTLLGKDVTEEELVSKGIDILSGLFKKKDSTKTAKNDEKEKNNGQTENNEDLEDDMESSNVELSEKDDDANEDSHAEDDHAGKNSDTSENLDDVDAGNNANEEENKDDAIEGPNSNEDEEKDNSEVDTNTNKEEEKKDGAKEGEDQVTKTGTKKKKD